MTYRVVMLTGFPVYLLPEHKTLVAALVQMRELRAKAKADGSGLKYKVVQD